MGSVTGAGWSVPELMAVALSRELRDGDVVRVGVATPVAEAAVRLAHLRHAPSMDLIFSGVRMNASDLPVFPMPAFGWDRRALKGVESFSDTGHRFDRVKDWGHGVFFIGGLQVDPHGNTIEYTTELELVDEDTWHPHLYDFSQPEVSDQWGTANQMNEFVAQRSFNDVDKGLFVAPPV